MNHYTILNQKTWLQERNNYIGASEIAILFNSENIMRLFTTPLGLWELKSKKIIQEITPELQLLFDAGHDNEPVAIHRFLKKHNPKIADKAYIHHINNKPLSRWLSNVQLFTEFKKGHMIAHPDMLWKNPVTGEWYNIEIKYVKYETLEWDFDDKQGDENGIPLKYYLQVQYQMYLAGLKKTILVVNFQGCDHFEFEIDVNKKLFPVFDELVNDFWGLVERNEPPPVCSRSDAKKLFPNKNFKSLTLTDDIELETIYQKDRFNMLKKRISRDKKEQESIKASVMSLMTNYNVLTTANGEQIAKISVSKPVEKIIKLSTIREEHKRVYKYLQKNDMITAKSKESFIF